ncbi:MAG TPA: aminotransferase class V-fold PLP-dependent enzyme, partial [Methyloceanibacter sp.]|nr:aminotransferase class V-fold PLP-dependent enzyme [Methyloceanibacter sp.]
MSERFYLDYNATAPLRPEVRDAMIGALALTGNPSSVHAEGRAARAAIDKAREQVAALVGARPEGVIFTSGGTEANAFALHLRPGNPLHYFASAIEHPSVLANVPVETSQIPVSSDGVVDLDWLAAALEKTG